jgi:ribosomal protein S18 acetylase RimI-like enzyme
MIRKAKTKDFTAIKKLLKGEKGLWDKNWRKNALELGITSSIDLSYVYEENNKIIGFVCAHDLGFRSYLSELVVDSKFRNIGIGKELVKKVEDCLREKGCKIIISDVWKNSIGFYKNLGWSEPSVILLRKRL